MEEIRRLFSFKPLNTNFNPDSNTMKVDLIAMTMMALTLVASFQAAVSDDIVALRVSRRSKRLLGEFRQPKLPQGQFVE